MSASFPHESEMPHGDELLLQRALDDELRPSEAIDFEARLAKEPALRARLRELEVLRDFRASAQPQGGLGLDFADRVTAQLFADRPESVSESVDSREGVQRPATGFETADEISPALAAPARSPIALLDRGILVAAALLLALGLGLMMRSNSSESSRLEAADLEVRSELKRLRDKYEEKERRARLERELREKRSEDEAAADPSQGK